MASLNDKVPTYLTGAVFNCHADKRPLKNAGQTWLPAGHDRKIEKADHPRVGELKEPHDYSAPLLDWDWDQNPALVYAVNCGVGQFVVIDIDNKSANGGPTGFDTWALWGPSLGLPADPRLVDTLVVESPTGGLHLYFKADQEQAITNRGSGKVGLELVNAARLAADPTAEPVTGSQIDIRGRGGYVIGPGSVSAKGEYLLLNDREPADLPVELETYLLTYNPAPKTPTAHKERSAGPVVDSTGSETTTVKGEQALQAVESQLAALTDGRKECLFNGAIRAARQGATVADTVARLTAAGARAGVPEWKAREQATNGANYGAQMWAVADSTKADRTQLAKLLWGDHYSDRAMARAFIDRQNGELVWFYERNEWWRYATSTGLWSRDHETKTTLGEFLESQHQAAKDSGDSTRWAIAQRLLTKTFASAVLEIAQTMVGISTDRLDRNPDTVAFANGVLDLRTGVLEPHKPENYLTMASPVSWNPNPTAKGLELLDLYLGAVAPDQRDYFQTALGQALTGYLPGETIFYCVGGGSNGKSALFRVVERAMGTLTNRLPSEMLVSKGNNSKEQQKMLLKGLRLGVFNELPSERYHDSQASKELTDSTVTGRLLYKEPETFANFATLFVLTNHMLQVREQTIGTWRRFVVFNFPTQFVQTPAQLREPHQKLADPRIGLATEQDPELLQALMWWLVQGAQRFYANGLIMPPAPGSMAEQVDTLRAENDRVLSFATERLIADPKGFILGTDLASAFNEWGRTQRYSALGTQNALNTLKQSPALGDFGATFAQRRWAAGGYSQSQWADPAGHDRCRYDDLSLHRIVCDRYQPTKAGVNPRAWFGVRFRTDSDPDPTDLPLVEPQAELGLWDNDPLDSDLDRELVSTPAERF